MTHIEAYAKLILAQEFTKVDDAGLAAILSAITKTMITAFDIKFMREEMHKPSVIKHLVHELKKQNHTSASISRMLNIHVQTVYYHLRNAPDKDFYSKVLDPILQSESRADAYKLSMIEQHRPIHEIRTAVESRRFTWNQ